ncbi:prolyl oligopeptidase family serine peptidase [Candidatus Woesearchaeota archaeon]|nr:prolyl oligopeptidase family serine peptidase [Candidatus Woesearchaeota archaeon]
MKGIDDIILNLFFYPIKLIEKDATNNSINKKIIYNKNTKDVLIILPQWMGKLILYKMLISRLRDKYTLVVYSLPYRLLNENPLEVVNYFNEAKNDILKTVNLLENQGYRDFSIFGTSLSTSLALMVANSDKRFKKIIIGLSGSHLSKSYWDSSQLLVKHIKGKMQAKGVNLAKLIKYWKILEPVNNIKNLKDKKSFVYLAKNDKIVPYKYGIALLDRMKREEIKFDLYTDNFFGHYLSGFRQLLFPNRIIRFLEN